MDDKSIPSPPVQTTEEYLRDKERGIVRIGKPVRVGIDGKLEPY